MGEHKYSVSEIDNSAASYVQDVYKHMFEFINKHRCTMRDTDCGLIAAQLTHAYFAREAIDKRVIADSKRYTPI